MSVQGSSLGIRRLARLVGGDNHRARTSAGHGDRYRSPFRLVQAQIQLYLDVVRTGRGEGVLG